MIDWSGFCGRSLRIALEDLPERKLGSECSDHAVSSGLEQRTSGQASPGGDPHKVVHELKVTEAPPTTRAIPNDLATVY